MCQRRPWATLPCPTVITGPLPRELSGSDRPQQGGRKRVSSVAVMLAPLCNVADSYGVAVVSSGIFSGDEAAKCVSLICACARHQEDPFGFLVKLRSGESPAQSITTPEKNTTALGDLDWPSGSTAASRQPSFHLFDAPICSLCGTQGCLDIIRDVLALSGHCAIPRPPIHRPAVIYTGAGYSNISLIPGIRSIRAHQQCSHRALRLAHAGIILIVH
ncbi:hypothetical protein GJAV_G00222470 [Gymnothorax javanicus]|nr:hypothetical protein GJAV_G00222470 [Gymnothorax javanicus]